MDAYNQKAWKVNEEMKVKLNLMDSFKTKKQAYHENNIAKVKHVVKRDIMDYLKTSNDGNTSFKSSSNSVNINLKTIKTLRNMESIKRPCKNFTENCSRSYKNFSKTKNKTTYSVTSVCSAEIKASSIKLFYSNSKKETNKAIFYKDICITGEKIALWRKLKRKISSLTSTDNNGVFNVVNVTKLKKQNHESSMIKPKSKTFLQKFWNFNCKCVQPKTKKCTNLPLIQFPDLPEPCLYEKCRCLKEINDRRVLKLRYCCDENCCKINRSKTSLTSAESVVKSCKIDISCGEPSIVAAKGVNCDIGSAKIDNCTNMSEHILYKINSNQCLDQEIETECHGLIGVEKRCASTQDDIQVECGDQKRDIQEDNHLSIKSCFESSILELTKNSHHFCDKGRNLIKKINKKYMNIIAKPEKKCRSRKTQTRLDKKSIKGGYKKAHRRNIEKCVGAQCVTSNAECQTFKKHKSERTKRVLVKAIASNKGCMYKSPLPELCTKKTQFGRPICKSQGNSKLVRLYNNFSRSKLNRPRCKYDTAYPPKVCKCNKKSLIARKTCDKCTSAVKCNKLRKISVETQCPIVKVSPGTENKSIKKKVRKSRFSKLSDHSLRKFQNTLYQKYCCRKHKCKPVCNSIGIQYCTPKPEVCCCTKDLFYSKNNKIRQKQTRSIGSQEISGHTMRNILLMKRNWSLSNLKKAKPSEPCRCVQSLMLIDEAYRNYLVNPALISKKARCEKTCYCCGHYNSQMHSNIRRALIAELAKKYVNRSIQCKVKCGTCNTKCKEFLKGWVSPCKCKAYCYPSCHTLYRRCKKNERPCKNKRYSPILQYCKRYLCRIRSHIREIVRLYSLCKESYYDRKETRRSNIEDDPNRIFLKTVRKPQYTRIYRQCPWAYPECLKCLGIWKQNIQIIFVIIAWILWCPCIIIMELFRLCCCYYCCE